MIVFIVCIALILLISRLWLSHGSISVERKLTYYIIMINLINACMRLYTYKLMQGDY